MKSLNRTLSLVLVLVMVFGMFGIASAATYSDAASVQYTEAVGVMTGIGAINGYTDGSFKPTGTISREEAAKMITYAVLGPTVASRLSVTATGFSDVANSRWSAPFIAYCVSKGIINGMGDGTFAPTANVTAYQLAKMMLCAAGHGAANEFIGPSWELNVAVSANKLGVFTGTKSSDYTKAATREEAALYVFNALTKVPEVSYNKLFATYTNAAKNTNDINSDNYLQIAEDVYSTLSKTATIAGGRVGYFWKLGSTELTSFVSSDVVLASSTDGTPYADLVTATNSSYIKYQADAAVTYYYNDGVASLSYPATDTVANNEATIKGYAATPGAVVQFIDTDNNSKYDKVSVTVKTVLQLAAAPVTTTSGSVTTITFGAAPLANLNTTNVSFPAGLAKGDVILYYVSATGMTYVEKAAVVTGAIASYTATYVTIGGVKYSVSGLAGAPAAYDTLAEQQALIGKAGFSFYLDNGKNICYTVASTNVATVSNTFFVAATDTSSSFGTTTYKANVVKMDGTQAVITVAKTSAFGGAMTAVASTTAGSSANGNLGAGIFYTYAVNADGSYNLTAATNQTANLTDLTKGVSNTLLDIADTSFVVTGNRAQFLGAATAVSDGTWTGATTAYTTSKIATSSTIFMYYDAIAKTYTVKTGITNAASYAAGGTIYVLSDSATNTYAQVVICSGGTTTASTSSYDKVFVTSTATTTIDANGTSLYSYEAIVNGVVNKTVTSYSALDKGTLYFTKDYAANGAVVSGGASTGLSGVTHTALTAVAHFNGTMTITGTPNGAYVLSGTCPIYLCSVNGTTTTVSQITADQAAALTYAGANDVAYVLPTSTTDTTTAAIYIYQIA